MNAAVHPIVELALEHVEVEEDTERPAALAEEGERALQDALRGRAGTRDLLAAVQALVNLAMHIDRALGGQELAERLLGIAAGAAHFLGDLEAELAADQEAVARAGRNRFAAFTGAEVAGPRIARAPAAGVRVSRVMVPSRFR